MGARIPKALRAEVEAISTLTDAFCAKRLDPEWRRDLLEQSRLAWLVVVNGIVADARWLSPELQVDARRRGLIPRSRAERGCCLTPPSL